jgi:hypothetical protein
MSARNNFGSPSHLQFQLGGQAQVSDNPPTGFTVGGVVKWPNLSKDAQNIVRRQLWPLLVLVENTGDADFTFSIQESSTNKTSDYSAVTGRVDGADYDFTTPMTVVAGGKIVVVVEPADVTDDYLAFLTSTAVRNGRLSIVHFGEPLEVIRRIAED